MDVIAGVGGVRLNYGDDGKVSGMLFGPQPEGVSAAAATPEIERALHHVKITEDDQGVTMERTIRK